MLAACASFANASAATPVPASALDRVAARLRDARGYTMRVDAHEERGDRSEDMTYRYERPAGDAASARPHIVIEEGRGSGATLAYAGRDRVAVLGRGIALAANLALDDARVTTLRGSNVLAAGLEPFVACANAHRASVSERRGPVFDGGATVAIVFERRGVSCPRDTKTDAELTLDVLFVSQSGAVPVLRKRYAGREAVVRWRIRDFALGPDPSR